MNREQTEKPPTQPELPLPRLPLWHPSRFTWTVRVVGGLALLVLALAMWRLVSVPTPRLEGASPGVHQ